MFLANSEIGMGAVIISGFGGVLLEIYIIVGIS
jgi:hypothetical protein